MALMSHIFFFLKLSLGFLCIWKRHPTLLSRISTSLNTWPARCQWPQAEVGKGLGMEIKTTIRSLCPKRVCLSNPRVHPHDWGVYKTCAGTRGVIQSNSASPLNQKGFQVPMPQTPPLFSDQLLYAPWMHTEAASSLDTAGPWCYCLLQQQPHPVWVLQEKQFHLPMWKMTPESWTLECRMEVHSSQVPVLAPY